MSTYLYDFSLSADTTLEISTMIDTYSLRFLWLDTIESWSASCSTITGEPVFTGRIVVDGQDLFGNYPKLGKLYVSGELTRNNFGKLYWSNDAL